MVILNFVRINSIFFLLLYMSASFLFPLNGIYSSLLEVFALSFNTACCEPLLLSPLDSDGKILYIVWPDNKTGNWDIFFTRSMDGGHTFDKTINISNDSSSSANPSIVSYGEHVSISWWDNKTGELQAFIRSSDDKGKNFENAIMLNSSISK